MACTSPVRSVLNRAYYRGMVAADPCTELQQLKRQYESALRVWGQYEFPLPNQPVTTRAQRFEQLQLKQRALDTRNAAHDRVLDHRRTCPLCAGRSLRQMHPTQLQPGMNPKDARGTANTVCFYPISSGKK